MWFLQSPSQGPCAAPLSLWALVLVSAVYLTLLFLFSKGLDSLLYELYKLKCLKFLLRLCHGVSDA